MISKRAVHYVRDFMGPRLRDLRIKSGLSQEALGEASGTSGKYIGEVERGWKSPTCDVLWKLLRALWKAGVRVPHAGAVFPSIDPNKEGGDKS